MKARLPKSMLRAKAIELYEEWLKQNPTPESERLKFSEKWINQWMREYGVSLLKPNKRFSVSAADRKKRITDFVKNIIRVRYFYKVRHGVEPEIINIHQRPLHRNKSGGQKTMTVSIMNQYLSKKTTTSHDNV